MSDSESRFAWIERLFHQALALAPERRDEFLDEACRGDVELREEVARLIARDASETDPGQLRERVGEAMSGDLDEASLPAKSIGPYRLLRRIGTGGMGVVYEAKQEQPVQRRVALKLIKEGMDTRQVVARFESERQALALMNHPNIAKVFDAGATKEGRPFFAMEYVSGESLIHYCDSQRLTLNERLELFVLICRGVEHAHQRGVIHRDLKPSNVLVSHQDGVAVPKIIDFGVSKAIAQPFTEKSLFTQQGMIVGTPEYMSPEQANLTNVDIDTRTDVYALGIMLYELLAGVRPFDSQSLKRAGFEEMLRRIREETPERPSARLASLGGSSANSAEMRQTDSVSLTKKLRGDLDWIVMKALEKKRDRRYGSPSELATDIQRHLSDEPVLAGPPSAGYRASKFVRRHRLLVAAATIALLGVIAGSVGTTVGFIRARDEAKRSARVAARAEAIKSFLIEDMLKSVDPSIEGRDVRIVDVLDGAAANVGERFAGQPDLEGAIRSTLGRLYRRLGLFEPGREQIMRGYDSLRETYADNHPEVLGAKLELARTMIATGQLEEAAATIGEVVSVSRQQIGSQHPDTLNAIVLQGGLLRMLGRTNEAAVILREAVTSYSATLGNDARNTAHASATLAMVLADLGEYEKAEPLAVDALETMSTLFGDAHPDTLLAIHANALIYHDLWQPEKADALYRRLVEGNVETFGETHPETITAMISLGGFLHNAGQLDEADEVLTQSLSLSEQHHGADDRWTQLARHGMAGLRMDRDELDQALALHQENLASRRRSLPANHPDIASSLQSIGDTLYHRESYSAALVSFNEAMTIYESTFGRKNPQVAGLLSSIATTSRRTGDFTQAIATLRELVDLEEEMFGPTHRYTLDDRKSLVKTLISNEELTAAESEARILLERRIEAGPAGHWQIDDSRSLLGECLVATNRYDEAEPLLINSYRALRENEEANPDRTREALERLLSLYGLQGRTDEAQRLRDEINAG